MNIKKKNFFNDNAIKYLLSKGLLSFGFRAFGIAFGFFIVWLLAYFFKEKVYGSFALSQTIIQLLVMIFTLGVQNTIIVEVNKQQKDDLHSKSFLIHVIKLVLFGAILPAILLFLLAPIISTSVFHKPHLATSFIITACFLPIFLLHDVFIYYFIALKKFISFGLFMFIIPNILFIAFILINKNSIENAQKLVLYYGLSFLITVCLAFITVFYKEKTNIKPRFSYKETLTNSLPMMFSGLMVFLMNWTDVLMIGALSTEENVGIYNAAFKIGMAVLIVIASINVVVAPKITEFYNNQNYAELKKIIQKSTQLVTLISIPIVFGLIFFSTELLQLFGENFIKGKNVLILISLSTFVSVLCGNVDQILNLTNKRILLFKINCVALIINILLNIYLIPNYGIMGAAIASLTATIVLNFTSVYFVKKSLGFYTLF